MKTTAHSFASRWLYVCILGSLNVDEQHSCDGAPAPNRGCVAKSIPLQA